MSSPITKNPGSYGIIIVILFAMAAFTITGTIINKNLIQYSSLPETVSFKVFDANKKDSVIFNLQVKPVLPIDSIGTEPDASSQIIERNILFHQNPHFGVWTMLILIMITIAAGSFPVFIGLIYKLIKEFKLSKIQLVLGICYSLVVALFLALTNTGMQGYYKLPKILHDFHILLANERMISNIVLTTIILIIPVMIMMFLIGPAADKIILKEISRDGVKETARKLESLNQMLKAALQLLAIIVVFSILTTSYLGISIKTTLEVTGFDLIPTEMSYIYGIYFTLFLCVMYIPIYLYLKQRYQQLKVSVRNVEEKEDIKDESWSQSILGMVKFEGTVMDNIKLAITILSPLLSSFLPEGFRLFN